MIPRQVPNLSRQGFHLLQGGLVNWTARIWAARIRPIGRIAVAWGRGTVTLKCHSNRKHCIQNLYSNCFLVEHCRVYSKLHLAMTISEFIPSFITWCFPKKHVPNPNSPLWVIFDLNLFVGISFILVLKCKLLESCNALTIKTRSQCSRTMFPYLLNLSPSITCFFLTFSSQEHLHTKTGLDTHTSIPHFPFHF